MDNIYDIAVNTIEGRAMTLADFKGKSLLIVNVASKCGKTPQYAGLERLYERFRAKGFSVLGFPCNQFLGQEPGTEAEIQEFCSTTYNVTFPLFSKIEVNGANPHPLYELLKRQNTQPSGPGDITWNFEKFLVNGQGEVVARFSPNVEPENEAVVKAIETALGQR